MKYLAGLILAAGLVAMSPAIAQEAPEKGHEQAAEHGTEKGGEKGEKPGMEMWKWANFLVLAGGLGYLVKKNAGPFFAARTQKIQQDMVEAQEARRQSEARAADVDRRLANLEVEIGALKADAQKEAEAEKERLSQYAAAEMAKIEAHAQQEIVAAGKAARMDLKRYSAELAVHLAEDKIRSRMTPGEQDALVRGFVQDLNAPARPTT